MYMNIAITKILMFQIRKIGYKKYNCVFHSRNQFFWFEAYSETNYYLSKLLTGSKRFNIL